MCQIKKKRNQHFEDYTLSSTFVAITHKPNLVSSDRQRVKVPGPLVVKAVHVDAF